MGKHTKQQIEISENYVSLAAITRARGQGDRSHAVDSHPPMPKDGHSHIWSEVYPFEGDCIWVCSICNELRWMPIDWQHAWKLTQAGIKYKNWKKAYTHVLRKYQPDIEEIIKLMEESVNGNKSKSKNSSQ